MAISEQIVNNAESALTTAISSGATSIAVANSVSFPTSGPFRVIVDKEIMHVTSVSGTTFNVTRGSEGTTASSHVLGSQVFASVTRDGLTALINQRMETTSSERPPYRIADAAGNVLTSSDFTENDVAGTMTITDDIGGSITLKHDPYATSEKLGSILRPTPTAPYTVTGAYRINALSLATEQGGIYGPILRRSSNDNRMFWRHRPLANTTNLVWGVNYYIGSVFQSGSPTRRYTPGVSNIVWFKIEDDNTDIKMSTSFDGLDFTEHYSIGRTVTLGAAPDQIGLCIDNLTPYDAYLTLLAWQE